MTIFFSHAHEQIERENKNKARKKRSEEMNLFFRASVKISTPRKTYSSEKKTKSHVKLPFSKQTGSVFQRGEAELVFALGLCSTTPGNEVYEKNYVVGVLEKSQWSN